jgi:anti-sigma factor RsiW
MQFDEYQDLLEEFVDGELDSETQESVASHVAGCSECSREVEILRRELELYSRYDRGIEVRPELWDGIASRIAVEREGDATNTAVLPFRRLLHHPQRNFIISAIAASVLLAALVVAPLVLRDAQPSNPEVAARPVEGAQSEGSTGEPNPSTLVAPEVPLVPPTSDATKVDTPVANRVTTKPAARRQSVDTSKSAPLFAVQSAEREYKRAIEVLSRDTDKARRTFAPELRDSVDKTLASLDRNIAGTRAVAYENPKDPIAAQYMMAAYQQKVETLQDIASLSTRIHDGQ